MSRKQYLLGIVMAIGFICCAPPEANAATFTLSPSTGTYAVGDTISVAVLLNTLGVAIDGVDVRYLTYNPTLLEVIDENTALAGIQILPGTLMPNTPMNTVDTALGRIALSQITSQGTRFTNNTPQVLATVRFRVRTSGTASVVISFTSGNTTDSNVASNGQDILTSVTNGSFVLGTAGGGGQPCHTISSGTLATSPYALAWNWISIAKELLLTAVCHTDKTTVTVGSGNETGSGTNFLGLQYVYHQGYRYINNAWTAVNLSCAGTDKTKISNAWCKGKATADLPPATSGVTEWFVGYTCIWDGSAWKCGCTTTACTTSYWQLQGIRR